MNLPLKKNKKASRSGRYRKQVMAPNELAPFAKNLESLFSELLNKRQLRTINDAEFLSFGLLALLGCRRPDAFQKRTSIQKNTSTQIGNDNTFDLNDFLLLLNKHELPTIAFKKNIGLKINLVDYLNQIRFRGIPDSARQSLLQWLQKQFPLHLLFYIPSVQEVFSMKKSGGRCVSFFALAKDLTILHHNRDVISFIVHDLIHAHEFYANKEMAQQQIGFYQWLDEIRNIAELQYLIVHSEGFRERWEYLLSDMNSYCGHLLKTFHAAFKIHATVPDSQPLWNLIVEQSNLMVTEKLLFLRINTPEWTNEDFLLLESIFEKKFTQAHLSHSFQQNIFKNLPTSPTFISK